MVGREAEAPERGDLVWLSFTPQEGHVQASRRPALVISPHSYNRRVGLALFCPVTRRVKNYPFEVALPSEGEISGVVLADQIKSLDWRARRVERISSVSGELIREVLAKVRVLVY